MQIINAILFDPVGHSRKFPSWPFEAIATEVFEHALTGGMSGSQAYRDVLNLLEGRGRPLESRERAAIEAHELKAVAEADAFEDVAPALSELHSLGITLIAAPSRSDAALGLAEQRPSNAHPVRTTPHASLRSSRVTPSTRASST